ncbi:UNKNOWN [Stylonychia lemnae]|uniref:Uncharacterized protein n=1 Tax=Stylonychia lemnae TaxID=5949 RepID=A0A077ZTN7_STYLE|nr:UNKNOWN [Stylonychia lemnae]|eukprot:CDW73262.1 UNKNOWN [Stylonychia lemnae]
MGQKQSKKEGLAVAGSTSVLTTGAGITLMVVGGPIGMVAGGIILGAGVSGAVSTTQQALNDSDRFDYKRWGLQTGIGAAGGAIAAPISIAGGALAGAGGGIATSTATRIGIQVGADMAGGIAAGAGTKVISNAVEGKKISKGVFKQALIGGLTGGVASGATQGLNSVISTTSSNIGRVALQTTSGAIVSGTTGALGAVLKNILSLKKIDKSQFIEYLKTCGAGHQTAADIWNELVEMDYIKRNEFTPQCEHGICLPKEYIQYKEAVNEIYLLSKDIWRDVWETAATSAALGGVMTGITSSARVLHNRDVKQVNKTGPNLIKKKLVHQKAIQGCESHDLLEYENQQEWQLIDNDEDEGYFHCHVGESKQIDHPEGDQMLIDLIDENLDFLEVGQNIEIHFENQDQYDYFLTLRRSAIINYHEQEQELQKYKKETRKEDFY